MNRMKIHAEGVTHMTEVSRGTPGTEEPIILERLSDLDNQAEFLTHFPDIRGWTVTGPTGDEIGVVYDLYVNPRNRQVEMAAINFSRTPEYGAKRVLVPVEELRIGDGKVRIAAEDERVRLAPEFHEGAPAYEPYYEYWGSRLVGPSEEPSAGFVRPPGRLELQGEEDEEMEETESRFR